MFNFYVAEDVWLSVLNTCLKPAADGATTLSVPGFTFWFFFLFFPNLLPFTSVEKYLPSRQVDVSEMYKRLVREVTDSSPPRRKRKTFSGYFLLVWWLSSPTPPDKRLNSRMAEECTYVGSCHRAARTARAMNQRKTLDISAALLEVMTFFPLMGIGDHSCVERLLVLILSEE